jgi:hypothetical protein
MGTCVNCGRDNVAGATTCVSCGGPIVPTAEIAGTEPTLEEPRARRPGDQVDPPVPAEPHSAHLSERPVASLAFSDDQPKVDPGGVVIVSLRLRNNGHVVDEFTLQVTGEPSNWATIVPTRLALMPGTEGVAQLSFRPPRVSATPAGPAAFQVHVQSRENPGSPALESGVILVGEYRDLVATLRPERAAGVHKARYRLVAENRGNAPVSAKVSAVDPDLLLELDADPARLGLPAGRVAEAAIRVRASQPFWLGSPEVRQFRVELLPDAGTPVTVPGSFVQRPRLPRWLPAVGGAAIAIALIMTIALAAGIVGPRPTPSESPTVAPTESPTVAPSESPTVGPSESPTEAPTEAPTQAPTQAPTDAPTEAPPIDSLPPMISSVSGDGMTFNLGPQCDKTSMIIFAGAFDEDGGSGLESVTLHYRQQFLLAPWRERAMKLGFFWAATLSLDVDVSYASYSFYVTARDNAGNETKFPLTDPYSFTVAECGP